MSELPPPDRPVWLDHLKAGQADALEDLWNRFYKKLVVQAKHRIQKSGLPTIDEESIACSVFESIWRAASEGRLESIESCDELWWWLLTAAHRKVVDHARRHSAQKRGGNHQILSVESAPLMAELLSREPDPEYLAILADEYERAISDLGDEKLQRIAVLKLSGATNEEIGFGLEVAPATVTRKVRRIYQTWAARGEI